MPEYHPSDYHLYNFDDFDPRRPAHLVEPRTQEFLRWRYNGDPVAIATTYIEESMATGNETPLEQADSILRSDDVPRVESVRATILTAYMPAYSALCHGHAPSAGDQLEVRTGVIGALNHAVGLLDLDDRHLAAALGVDQTLSREFRRDITGDAGDGTTLLLSLSNSHRGQGDMAYLSSQRQDRTLPFARVFNRRVFNIFTLGNTADPDNLVPLGVKTRYELKGRQKNWDTPQFTLRQVGTKALEAAQNKKQGEVKLPYVSDIIRICRAAENPSASITETVFVHDFLRKALQAAFEESRRLLRENPAS